MSRLQKEETPVTDVQEEQDKAKMLLGSKLLVSAVLFLIMLIKQKNLAGRMSAYTSP
jgi:hypothetical protein